MKILSVTRYKGSTFEAELDDGRKLYLHADIITDFGIRSGMETDRDTLRKIIYASNFRRAYQRALYLLDYRDYTYKEMLEKLVDNYKSEALCTAVMKGSPSTASSTTRDMPSVWRESWWSQSTTASAAQKES